MAPKVAEVDTITVEAVDEIDWNPKPKLLTGMDYHDGIAYITAPFQRNIWKPGKKKDDEGKVVTEWQTMAITSTHRGIWYNAEDLDAHGFVHNENYIQETEARWSLESRRNWLQKNERGPKTKTIFDELKSIYTTYVEFADEIYYDLMPLFVMYTYVFRLFESTGYIHFNGTRASGKSRNLSILSSLCFNTIMAASMSAPAMYRKLEGSPGTTILDESEGFEGERGEDLRRVLNAGYKSGQKVMRVEKINERWTPVPYDVFGPKVLASINQLEDTIRTRCIIVAMRPTVRAIPDFLMGDPRWPKLRDKLYLWALENTEPIATLADKWLNEKKNTLAPKIISREWETTAQYIILADYIGGEPFAMRVVEWLNAYFKDQQVALDATDRLRTTLRALPRVLATVAKHPSNYYSIKEIHEVISSYMEADATEYFKTRHVTKNLNVLGFKTILRTKGGVQIQLNEDEVRKELIQRRVEPFDEDKLWFTGEQNWQDGSHIIPEKPVDKPEQTEEHWWDSISDEPTTD